MIVNLNSKIFAEYAILLAAFLLLVVPFSAARAGFVHPLDVNTACDNGLPSCGICDCSNPFKAIDESSETCASCCVRAYKGATPYLLFDLGDMCIKAGYFKVTYTSIYNSHTRYTVSLFDGAHWHSVYSVFRGSETSGRPVEESFNVDERISGVVDFICAPLMRLNMKWDGTTNFSYVKIFDVNVYKVEKPEIVSVSANPSVTSNEVSFVISLFSGGLDTNVWIELGTDMNNFKKSTLIGFFATTSLQSPEQSKTATLKIANLNRNKTYYYRVVAQNALGTAYSPIKSFTFPSSSSPTPTPSPTPTATPSPYYPYYSPLVVTLSADRVNASSARLSGKILDCGGSKDCNVWFEWGNTKALGNKTPLQKASNGDTFHYVLTGLKPDFNYYFAARASNPRYSDAGAIHTFKTQTYSIETIATDVNKWHGAPFYIKLNCVAVGIDCNRTLYRINGEEWIDGNIIHITKDGIYLLEFYSEAVDGSAEPTKTAWFGLDTKPPKLPDNFNATTNKAGITLSWSRASDETSGVAKYILYRNGIAIADTNELLYVDTNVNYGASYKYELSVVDVVGNYSTTSKELTVKIPKKVKKVEVVFRNPREGRIPAGPKGIKEIIVELKTKSGEKLDKKIVNAIITINGIQETAALTLDENGMYRYVLSDPLKEGAHHLQIKLVSDEIEGEKDINFEVISGVAQSLTTFLYYALILALATAGIFLVYRYIQEERIARAKREQFLKKMRKDRNILAKEEIRRLKQRLKLLDIQPKFSEKERKELDKAIKKLKQELGAKLK